MDKGPQTVSFGQSLLLEGSPGFDEKSLKERGFGPEGDRELIEAILVFSKLLVEKCANRAVYNSTDRLNDLLNTTSLSLLHSTLRITFYLAQRYAERSHSSHHLAGKFYDFDHDRLLRLALPFGQPQAASSKRAPTSPVKTTKSKEKLPHGNKVRRSSVAANPNDFRALCKDLSQQGDRAKSTAGPDRDWQAWAHVKVSWTSSNSEQSHVAGEASQISEPPSTPTPVRQSSLGLSRLDTNNSPSESGSRSAKAPDDAESHVQHVEFSPSDLVSNTIESILRNQPDDMPPKARYELLHQLRVAYGLMTSSKARKELLAIRLLSIASLSHVLPDMELSSTLFSAEHGGSKPQELVQQLVSLLHDAKKGQQSVSLYLQTVAIETMGVLAHFKQFASEINAALGGGSSQGLLSQIVQKGLNDIAKDNDSTDTPSGDDWREAVFSLPRMMVEATGHHGRSSEMVIASSFITSYLSGFNVTTGKALRVHTLMLDFLKTFFHHFKDGLAALLTINAFETVSNLLGNLVHGAWDLLNAGNGIPTQYKTRATDYEIPYAHQQIIRSIIDMINDISGHQGAQADRVLRSLVDSQALLRAFRLITDHLAAFGAHTWSEVIKAICGFLHNEPTSFTVISEAGIIQSLLDTVNAVRADPGNPSDQMRSQVVSATPQNRPQGIPPVVDAIINISQVFGAICLTTAGFDLFKASGALEKFFEIFESPAHVKVLNDPNILALLGSTFDELIRHHPNLRDTVMSAVIVMLARVRHICRSLSVDFGAGPKLWLGSDAELVPCGGHQALSMEVLPLNASDPGDSTSVRTIELPNGVKLSLSEDVLPPSTVSGVPSDQDSNGLKANDYARPAIAFLVTFFEHQAHCTSFLEHGGCDLVLDFITLPSLPVGDYAFDRRDGMFQELSSAVHMMAETKPHLVIPALADRARFACSELSHFIQSQPSDWTCYFAPLIKPTSLSHDGDPQPAPGSSEVEANGTRVARCMMAVFCLAQVLGEVFNVPMYSQRSSQNYLFGLVNLEDVFADICKMMGGISAACYREDIAIQRSVPEPWISAARPEHFSTGDDEVDKILSVRDTSTRLPDDTAGEQAASNTSMHPEQPDTSKLNQDKDSPLFKNVHTLRFLLIETPAAITEFFCRLGRSIIGRRRPDTFARQKTALVANALASAYLTQLQPYFIEPKLSASDVSEDDEPRFTYFVIALDNVRRSFYDDCHPSAGPMTNPARQSFVVEAFRKAGGIKTLSNIGTEFFDKLKSCKVEHSIFSANTGLKICLDILKEFTDSRSIMESAQSNSMKSTDPSRQYFFVPAQVLLSLRIEALQLTRLVWESEYADQASKDVVQKLVSILKHVLTGDHENEAVQTNARQPQIAPFSPKKLAIDPQRVITLKEKGFDEELAREALYRTNMQPHSSGTAEEYCRALASNPRRRRLPVPERENDAAATSNETPGIMSPPTNSHPVSSFLGVPSSGTIEAALAEVVHAVEDNEMEDVTDSNPVSHSTRPSGSTAPTSSSAMNIHNLLNNDDDPPADPPQPLEQELPTMYTVESITAQRASIREDLAERCNNILNNHQNLTFELSDLIISATKKLSEDLAKDYWRTTSDLLVSSLLSMQVEDDINEARGKKIAAAAHLVALLMQDSEVFKETLGIYQESYEGIMSFLQLPSANGRTAEDSFPWVAPVLLILEKMLSRDCEPAEVKWDPPNDLDSTSEAIVTPVSVFDMDAKRKLFEVLVDLLPRVGKDKGMALAIARVLSTLTRTREIASKLAERRNLQRLFLMVKQLANGVGHRLQTAFMLILRHIVEDDETLRQIMRSEIKAFFSGRNSTRQIDTTSYVRELHHLVLRSPEIFVEVTNETVKLASWQPHSGGGAGLVLKETAAKKSADDKNGEEVLSHAEQGTSSVQPASSIEAPQDSMEDPARSKPTGIKPPVVEHPDGVIHFILSELLNYKDVEDKETVTDIQTPASMNASPDPSSQAVTADSPEPTPVDSTQTKPDKPKFKPEDHPIFAYRCFLLYSLTELLHSYNRTKVELINFSRKADPMVATPSKPRSGILNYFLNGLIPSGYVDKDDSLQFKKKLLTSDWAIRVIGALCSKTGESGLSGPAQRYSSQPQIDDVDNEPDLTFVRRFVLEHAIKSYKDASVSNEPLQMKYSRLLCLAHMFNRLLSKPSIPDGFAGASNSSYKILGRMMFEKNLAAVLTSSLADIDLSYPGSKRVVKFILKPLHELTSLATQLSFTSPDFMNSVVGNMSEDVISSASSVSDIDEEREETPDLFRNSALGMLDPNRDPESDSGSEEEDEDEEMYDEEYDDEMEYENPATLARNDEPISDEEIEDEMGPDGEMEGLPGDIPMDMEFVVNDPHMEVDTEDDEDDDEDSEDDEDEDEDEDGEDFIIEDDDDAGEINADDENHSLHEGLGDEGDWEDEDDDEDEEGSEEQDEIAEIAFDGDDMPLEQHLDGGIPAPGVLSNLLRVLGDHDHDGPDGMPHPVPPELIVPAAGPGDPDDEDDEDEEDEDEDGEEIDENDEMDYGTFDDFIAGEAGHALFGAGDALVFGPGPAARRHRPIRTPGGRFSNFIERRMGHRDDFHSLNRASRLLPHPRPGGDDGTNPLLRRPQHDHLRHHRANALGPNIFLPPGLDAIPGMGPFPPFGATFQTFIRNGDGHEAGGHGAVLDAILQALHRGERPEGGRLQFTVDAPLSEIRDALRPNMGEYRHRHHHRDDYTRTGNLVPAQTTIRWQEEARLLFGNTYVDKIQRVQILVMSTLVPLAQREEKERRRKREEEQKAEREEMERLREEAEKRRKEEEEREAEAEAERARAEAEAAAAARSQDDDSVDHDDGDTEPMEDVQGTESEAGAENVDISASIPGGADSQDRIFTSIRGRQIDITGLEIDHDYLEALPEDLREEVIMQQYASRREQARQDGHESSGIDPDFLNALPEELREEIRQQEAHAQRRREREAARRQVTNTTGPVQAEEMDSDNFLATLDPAFRRVILAEQPPEILRQLDPRHAAEGRAHARRLFPFTNMGDRDPNDDRANEDAAQREMKRQVIQIVDKSGVATLLRLMFLPLIGSIKSGLLNILRNVCLNRQTRLEVIHLLLVVLKEGSTDVSAVERSLANLSLRAKAAVGQKTPQPLKRTLSMQPSSGLSQETTPLLVVKQCLSALKHLTQNSSHTRTIFLREVDTNLASKKGKGKVKDIKTAKYPVNDLIGLLDRKLIVEDPECLQILAEILAFVSQPLPNLLRKEKEKEKSSEEEKPTGDGEENQGEQAADSSRPDGTMQQASEADRDVEIRDAPAAVVESEEGDGRASSAQQVEPRDSASKWNADTSNEDLTVEESKSKKVFEAPEISEHNLQLVVSIFVAPECNSDTFHSTLEALSSLSSIPGTSPVFGTELIHHVKILSQAICNDLDELIPQLREAQSITDLHALSSSKFSHGGSDQVKLLRVLQALDYLSAPKSENEESEENAVRKSVLTSSYESLALRPLWTKLSECLTTVREKDNITSFATILLPLIESLMVVCKNTSLKDSILARQLRDQMPGSPVPEATDDLQDLFFNFTTEHRKILNDIIRQSPKLMQGNGSFSLLVKNPKVLDFDNKRAYFTKQIHSRLHQQRHIQPPLQLNVRRDQVFLDSYKALYYKSAEEMKYGKLNIRFNGEEGVDAGGVTREWFQVLARGMFNPDWALWQPVAADRTTFHPNPLSWINGEHLLYFKFIGRIIGKALHEGRVLDCHFSRAVYKRLLGKEPNLKDLESMDLDYYKSLVWILENDITDVITEDFSVIEEQFGQEKVVDLIPDGRNIPVTEENKREYVNAQVRYRLTTSVREQLENFVRGFHDIIPAELVAIFDEQELELLISGLPEIDVDDWKAHTEYHNYNANSPQVTWFWRIVRGMSNEERAKLLQFVTGTSKVPLNGFKDLEGMQGNTLFSIHK